MPSLACVTIVASGQGRREGRCIVFHKNKKLIAGAIVHKKDDGGFSLYSGDHIIDMAKSVYLKGENMLFNHTHYNLIPEGVVVAALIHDLQ